MFTKTRLRQVLRSSGCLRPRDHIKGMLEAQRQRLRWHAAQPPSHEDEAAGRDFSRESWVIKVPVATRRLMRSWQMTGHNKRSRVTDATPEFSAPVDDNIKGFAYASEPAVTYNRDNERPIPFSSEREEWDGVRGDI